MLILDVYSEIALKLDSSLTQRWSETSSANGIGCQRHAYRSLRGRTANINPTAGLKKALRLDSSLSQQQSEICPAGGTGPEGERATSLSSVLAVVSEIALSPIPSQSWAGAV